METIKVKRSPESKGRCKLAWNKVYTATVNSFDKSSYIIGGNAYLSKWFTPVTDPQPKSKPILTTDVKTGKLKVERDWSKPQAFPNYYKIPKNTRVVKITKDDHLVKKGSIGVTKEESYIPYIKWENKDYDLKGDKKDHAQIVVKLAPINPTEHPEHPDFGKIKGQSITKTWVDEFAKIQKENSRMILTTPEPTDIRDTIAEYVKKYGHQLTAIELIGHITIDELR